MHDCSSDFINLHPIRLYVLCKISFFKDYIPIFHYWLDLIKSKRWIFGYTGQKIFQRFIIYLHNIPGLQDSKAYSQVSRQTCLYSTLPQEGTPDISENWVRSLLRFQEVNKPSTWHRCHLLHHTTDSCVSRLLQNGWNSHLSCLKCCFGHLKDKSSCTFTDFLRRLRLWQDSLRLELFVYQSMKGKS